MCQVYPLTIQNIGQHGTRFWRNLPRTYIARVKKLWVALHDLRDSGRLRRNADCFEHLQNKRLGARSCCHALVWWKQNVIEKRQQLSYRVEDVGVVDKTHVISRPQPSFQSLSSPYTTEFTRVTSVSLQTLVFIPRIANNYHQKTELSQPLSVLSHPDVSKKHTTEASQSAK